MSQYIGTWGREYFGRGYFGWAQCGVPISFSLLNSRLIGLLTQNPPNSQLIATEVLIGAVDVSSLIERVDVAFSEDSSTGSCGLVLIGTAPASLVDGAAVEVSLSFILEDGTRYTTRIFNGRLKSVLASSGGLSKTVQVQCWDAVESNLAAATHNTSWTGTARDLVSDELTRCGCPDHNLTFTDFSMTSATLAFRTVRDLVNTIANQADEARIISTPDGRVWVWSYASERATGISMPMTGYTSMQSPSSRNDRYRSYSVSGSTGITSIRAGTGDYDEGENLGYLADGSYRAASVIAKSERQRRLIQAPINPYLKIGDKFGVVTDAGTEYVRITGISHSIQWSGETSPGCWSAVAGEVVA